MEQKSKFIGISKVASMATAVRLCAICRKIFPGKGRRKTCSYECQAELLDRRTKAVAAVKPPEPPPKQPAKPKTPVSAPRYLPSPEEIRQKCSLMKSGLLVIESDGTPTEVDPAK